MYIFFDSYFIYFNNPSEVLDILWDFLKTLIFLINLLIVLFIFVSNRRHAEKVRIIEKKSLWFRTLIIEKQLSLIYEYYKNIESEIEELFSKISLKKKEEITVKEYDDLLKEYIQKIIKISDQFRKSFIESISPIDEIFASELVIQNNNVVDEITLDLQLIRIEDVSKKKNLSEILINDKRAFFKKLYRYDLAS